MRPGTRHERAAPTPVRGTGGSIVSLLGRCGGLRGRCWVAAGDHRGRSGHRSARGPARAFPLVTPARSAGPSSARSPANSSTHERDSRNDQWDTFTERRKVSPGLRDVSERLVCIASGVPGTRRALPSACPRRPDPGADSSGRLAVIAWLDMTYLGGAPSRSGPCHRSGFRPRRAVREEKGQPPGSRRRAGGGSFGVARWLRRDHPGPGRGRSSRGVVLVPLGGHQIGQAQARSLSRSVFRVIPRSRAAWNLLPSVDPSTSGRRSLSRLWCASW